MTSNGREELPFQLPSSLEERITAGLEANRITTDEIIPFPADFDVADLDICLAPGPVKTEIFRLLNLGWKASFDPYHSATGLIIMGVLRLDSPRGREKFIRPLTVSSLSGIRANLRCRPLAPLRPLYRLDRLVADRTKDVLIVEGEKAASAGQKLLPELILTTWSGGAQAFKQTDWEPLIGRRIIICPDNDLAGKTAAQNIAKLLAQIGAESVRIVNLPSTFPEKWDLADPVPEFLL